MDFSYDTTVDVNSNDDSDEDDCKLLWLLIGERQGMPAKKEEFESDQCPQEIVKFIKRESEFHQLENMKTTIGSRHRDADIIDLESYKFETLSDDYVELLPLNDESTKFVDVKSEPCNTVYVPEVDDQIKENIDRSRDLAAKAEALLMEKLRLQRKLDDLNERIRCYDPRTCDKKLKEALRRKGQDCFKSSLSARRASYQCRFGMPYFKTINRFPADRNSDLREIVNNNEVALFRLPCTRKILFRDKYKIEQAVLAQLKRKRVQVLQAQLQQVLDSSAAGNADYSQQKLSITKAIDYIQSVKDVREAESWEIPIDFMEIGCRLNSGRFTYEDYERIWRLCGGFKSFDKEFSSDEVIRLKQLRRQYQDWDRIASLLGDGRSGYACFVKWSRTRRKDASDVWTPKEDRILSRLCAKLAQIKDRALLMYYWRRIRRQFPHRTYTQIHAHWQYVLRPSLKKGRFTHEETEKLYRLKREGKSFREIASIFPTRSTVQLRAHFENQVSRATCRRGHWTIWEEEELRKLTDRYGTRDWKKISEKLGTRTRSQCRTKMLSLWSEKEAKKFDELVEKHGTDMKRISAKMRTKSVKQCHLRYQSYYPPEYRAGRWSRGETKLFTALLEERKDDFDGISGKLRTKSVEQCRAKFERMRCSRTSVAANIRSHWTAREIERFDELSRIYGSDIEKIYETLKTKSLTQCRLMYKERTIQNRDPAESATIREGAVSRWSVEDRTRFQELVRTYGSEVEKICAALKTKSLEDCCRMFEEVTGNQSTSKGSDNSTERKESFGSSTMPKKYSRWTTADISRFEELVHVYGCDVEKICASMKTKTLLQCCNMYEKMSSTSAENDSKKTRVSPGRSTTRRNSSYWTVADKKRFKELIRVYGFEVEKLCASFQTKSLKQCAHMYVKIASAKDEESDRVSKKLPQRVSKWRKCKLISSEISKVKKCHRDSV